MQALNLDREQQTEIANQSVRLHHFPYRNPYDPDQRYFDHRPQDDGGWLLHEHVHHRWKIKGKQINVGVDILDFKPISLAQIEKDIKQIDSVRQPIYKLIQEEGKKLNQIGHQH